MPVYDEELDGCFKEPIKRRGFLATILALMAAPKWELPYKVIDKPVVSHDVGNLRQRLMRLHRLSESELLKFRSLLYLTPKGKEPMNVAMAPFLQIGKEGCSFTWELAKLESQFPFTTFGMHLVDDQGYILRYSQFTGGSQYLHPEDCLRATQTLSGLVKNLPNQFELGGQWVTSDTLCNRINIRDYEEYHG